MDQTRGIDRTKPIADQIIEILDSRYYAEAPKEDQQVLDGILGGRFQHHKKVAMDILSLTSDYYHKHPEEVKPYVED